MPRLTGPDFIQTHHQLREWWLEKEILYAHLEPREQWDLHAYFQSSKGMNGEDLLEHRKTAAKQDPSLPQRAGRALSRIRKCAVPAEKRKRTGHIKVYPLVNPEPDFRQLARAFIAIAELQKPSSVD